MKKRFTLTQWRSLSASTLNSGTLWNYVFRSELLFDTVSLFSTRSILSKISLTAVLTTALIFHSANAVADDASQALLQHMQNASRTLNYDMAFITISAQHGVESLRFRHAYIDRQSVSQLLQMDGPRREVVQRGDEISYFDPGLQPFTLPGNYIISSLPSLVYANLQQLASYYDFIPMGRARIANSLCNVVRIVSRDGNRYSYIVWLDTQTSLPLRVDLLDNDGEALEQFRVINYNVSQQPDATMAKLPALKVPPLLAIPLMTKQRLAWQVNWLPAGFQEMSSNRHQLEGINQPVESRLYFDGLFSFSLNVSHADSTSSNQLLRIGRRTIISQISHNKDITLVGELPPSVAKRIMDSIKFTSRLPAGTQ